MSITNSSKKGFTLIEVLIALVLSSMVLAGVYTTFSSLLNTKEATEDSYYKNNLLISARKLVKPDMMQMHKESLSITTRDGNDALSFITNNSIKLEKAVPVTVSYYVEDDYLIREEKNTSMNYEWKMPLIGNVTEFKIQSHNGNTFTDEYDRMDTIVKVTFKVKEYEVAFIAGCGHLSLSSDYLGGTWN
jgi:prepilin-type N-terminal cleavage/methylation domain-containing protein